MKKLHFVILTVTISVCISCDQEFLRPDPIPDPSKFAANQTILEDFIIQSIAFGEDGSAWIGTRQGLIHYSKTHSILYNSLNSNIKYGLGDIAIDSKNNIWMATKGLYKFDGDRVYHYTTANSDIPEDIVWSVAVNSNDDVWVASSRAGSGGIAKFNGERFEVFTPENSPLPVNSTHAIAVDSNDNVWAASQLGVYQSYLTKISGDSWTVYDSSDFHQNLFEVLDIEINSKNQVCGVIHYSLPLTRYHSPNAFCFDEIVMDTFGLDSIRGCQSIFVDNSDNLWCTFGHGYACFAGDEYIRVDSKVIDNNGVSTYETWFSTISQAPDGNIWVGTGEGIRIIEEIE